RRGIWENLFRQLARNGRSTDTQMIDSTHVKAHRPAAGGKGGRKSRLLAARAEGTQEFEALANKIGYLVRQAGDVAVRSRQAGDQAGADRVPSRRENDGDDRRRLLGSQDHGSARRDNNINLALDEFGGNLRGALGSTLRPAILDRDRTTLNPAEFAQSLYKSGGPLALSRRRGRAQVPDDRQLRRLLRARAERPRSCRAAEHRDERAPLHSITSSARASRVGGISMPRAFAVVKLMTRSNFVGCSTGISPGFVPRRILSTWSAAPRNALHRT